MLIERRRDSPHGSLYLIRELETREAVGNLDRSELFDYRVQDQMAEPFESLDRFESSWAIPDWMRGSRPLCPRLAALDHVAERQVFSALRIEIDGDDHGE